MKKSEIPPLSLPLEEESRTWALTYEDETVLTLALRIPKLPEKPLSLRRAGRFCRRAADSYRQRWEGELYRRACLALTQARERSRPFHPWEADLEASAVYLDGGYLSLCMDAHQREGVSRPSLTRFAMVWPLSGRFPCTLEQFLGKGCRRRVLAGMAEQIEARVASGESLYFEDYPRRLSRFFDPDRFYLTPEGVALFYPVCSLAPYAEGLPVFLFPRQD